VSKAICSNGSNLGLSLKNWALLQIVFAVVTSIVFARGAKLAWDVVSSTAEKGKE